SPVLAWEQVHRRHFGTGIDGAQVFGELTYHPKPGRPLALLHTRGQLRPSESQIDRHKMRALVLCEAHESPEQAFGPAQLEAQASTEREVCIHCLSEVAH